MAEENVSFERRKQLAHPEPGDEIVITGISGRYPECSSVHEFRDKLFMKENLTKVSDRRYKSDDVHTPRYLGSLKDLKKFDASYFGYHFQGADYMDPIGRICLEAAFEAILDAGYNPSELENTRLGVFQGTCASETETLFFTDALDVPGSIALGCNKYALSAQIQRALKARGPTDLSDAACSSSSTAVERALIAFRHDQCDAAIVMGANLCLTPQLSRLFGLLGVINKDGRAKVFDITADGYTRSEAIIVIFLQKSKNARRSYCELVHCRTNSDGNKPEGITFPSGKAQYELLKEVYEDCGVDPRTINYIEAHATGTKVGDPEECKALDKLFSSDGKTMLVGSVKSNVGHSEPASGLVCLTKCILAYETGLIPPNINLVTHKPEIKSIVDGRFKVVTEATKLPGDLICTNSFGFGGSNAHLFLKRNNRKKVDSGCPADSVPRLVGVSGRTEEAVCSLINDMISRSVDVDYCKLYHGIFSKPVHGHYYRGFAILHKNAAHQMQVQLLPKKEPPLYFIFPSLGSEWPGMGKHLLEIPPFAAAIEKCCLALKTLNVDLQNILTKSKEDIFDDFLNACLGNTAFQIGVIDIMRSLNLKPSGVFGYSVGSIACAYSESRLSTEEAILAAYHLGSNLKKISELKSKSDKTENIKHNSYTSDTTNLKNIEKGLIPELQQTLLDDLSKVLNNGKTVVYKESRCKLLSSKLFASNGLQSNLNSIPCGSVIVEVGPVSSLKSLIPPRMTYFNLSEAYRNDFNSLLSTIGRLYLHGFTPALEHLYSPVPYPVARGTPMIAPLIKWDHDIEWLTVQSRKSKRQDIGQRIEHILLKDEDFIYMRGHTVDGRTLVPGMGYVYMVWESFAIHKNVSLDRLPMVFRNVRFVRATSLQNSESVFFNIMFHRSSGKFVVADGQNVVATGSAFVPEDVDKYLTQLPDVKESDDPEEILMKSKDIYKELRLRGYQYSGPFKALQSLTPDGTRGTVKWEDNWVTYLDGALQPIVLSLDTRNLYVPTYIKKIVIDPTKVFEAVDNKQDEDKVLPLRVDIGSMKIQAVGVQFSGIKANPIQRRKPRGEPVLEKYGFVPHCFDKPGVFSMVEAMRLCAHLALENIAGNTVKIAELGDTLVEGTELVSHHLAEILGDLPLVQAEVKLIASEGKYKAEEMAPGVTLSESAISSEGPQTIIVGSNFSQNYGLFQECFKNLKEDGFLISREKALSKSSLSLDQLYLVNVTVGSEKIVMLKKRNINRNINAVVTVSEDNFKWVKELKELSVNPDIKSILLVCENQPTNGILGLVNCLRKEPGAEKIRCVFILDPEAPHFSLENQLYSNQLAKCLVTNVYQNGQWGSYRHQALPLNCTVQARHAFVNTLTKGDLSTLRWLEGPLCSSEEFHSPNRVDIAYTSINFKDVMLLSGKLSEDSAGAGRLIQEVLAGFEFSGFDQNNGRVMGTSQTAALASCIITDPQLLWPVPDEWTLEDAATVPVVYSTVIYALVWRAKIKKTDSILIPSGAGGIGIAAITIASHYGCKIITTVGSDEKREYLKKQFPHLKDSQIGYSRDLSFEDLVMRETNGRGVDIVLNSLADDKLQACVRCLTLGGCFIEIGKYDLFNNTPIATQVLKRGGSYHGVMLDQIIDAPDHIKKIMNDVMMEGLRKKIIKPLKRTVFPVNKIEEAMRYLTTGKHIGKAIIKIRDENASYGDMSSIEAIPRFFCNPEKTYIIIGGLGGFGLELVDWLILRNARKVVLVSRTGLKNGYQAYRLRIWRNYGTKVIISTSDVTTKEGCKEVLDEANQLGPVGGIFNLAVVLKDSIFENQTEDDFVTSFSPKATTTKHLDKLTRELCPQLEHFVVFSSVSCGRGNAGQTNYGMANSVMERICEKRVSEGYPGLAIQWGAVGDVGLVADMLENKEEMVIGGTLTQSIKSCLQCMDVFLKQKHPVVGSMVVAEKKVSSGGSIMETIANLMGIQDIKQIPPNSALVEMGMDSMVSVEVKQTLEREFNIFLTATDLKYLTFAKLQELTKQQQQSNTESSSTEVSVNGKKLGIDLLLRFIGDETDASIEFEELNSEYSGERIVLIPGIEGVSVGVKRLVKNLKSPVLCLQYPYPSSPETVAEISQHMYKVLREKEDANRYTIVAFSFGTLIALEMALKLKADDKNSNLIFLDGSPDFFQLIGSTFFNVESTYNTLETDLLVHLSNIYINSRSDNLKNELSSLKTWDEKLSALINSLPADLVSHSRQHLVNTANVLYSRVKALVNYTPTVRQVDEIVLFKPSQKVVNGFKDNYDLQKYSKKSVAVHEMRGNHHSMLENPQLADMVYQFHQSFRTAGDTW